MMQKQKICKSYEWLLKNISPTPSIALILGSGLGDFIDPTNVKQVFNYQDIPEFPVSTAPGHAGKLFHINLHGKNILVFSGRFHLYEGYSPFEVVYGVRVAGLMGVKTLILTNAAGALNPLFKAGELMLITDHINFSGENPLIGENWDDFGPRFPDMSQVYSQTLQELAEKVALDISLPLYKGIYIQIKGPSLETPAETRVFRLLGADAIGMSTVLEAIAAKHMGMNIVGISCLTNKNLPDCMSPTSEEEILNMARKTNKKLKLFLDNFIQNL
ncbi:MAG: purine-nucleoside phosphorylase [Desulfonauticus sp.]|nr:purine-nucleoside phosphorylase [Desulfonauticus sp.]